MKANVNGSFSVNARGREAGDRLNFQVEAQIGRQRAKWLMQERVSAQWTGCDQVCQWQENNAKAQGW